MEFSEVRLYSPAPIAQGRQRGDAHIVGYYVSYVQIWPDRDLSVHKKRPAASGRGQSEGSEPREDGSSDP